MRTPSTRSQAFFTLVIVAALLLVACKKMDVKQEAQANALQTEMLSATVLGVDMQGKTLAANCFQCHGTNGFAGELKIASMGASEIINKFNSYKTMDPRADIMYVHAQAYNTEEIQLIADFFSKQK